MKVGFHCSHEQFDPGSLLDLVRHAEAAGFQGALSSDHLAPWSSSQGESGHAWTWLGAALHATSLPFGVVTAPGYRYHPAVTAQALATAATMFPGRVWAALGSGLALNEHVTGGAWPAKPERNRRLHECAGVIRALLAGDTVDHHGLVTVEEAKLWTVPDAPPMLAGAALSPPTAAAVAEWADGLITINLGDPLLARTIDAFRTAGGDGKPVYLQVHVSWAPSEEEALANAHDQWRANSLGGPGAEEIPHPEHFDALASNLPAEAVRGPVLVSSDLGWHRARIEAYADLGIDACFVHNVGRNQRAFIDAFAAHVLGHLVGRS